MYQPATKTKKTMRKYIYTILCFAFVGSLTAQNVEFKASNFKDKKEEFKKAITGISKGDDYLEKGLELLFQIKDPGVNLEMAYNNYMIAHKLNPNNAEVNFKLGQCMIETHHKDQAVSLLLKAYELDKTVDPWMEYYVGMAYQLKMEWDEALSHYKKFQSSFKKADDPKYKKFISLRKKQCATGKRLASNPVRAWIDNLKPLNSSANDFGPSITMDGSTIVFTSTRKNGHEANEFGGYDTDLYSAEYSNGKWSAPRNMGKNVNSKGDEISSMMAYDGSKLLMFKKNDEHEVPNYDVFQSRLNGATWATPESVSRNINTRANQSFPSYNFDGVKIYYLSDKATSSSSGLDIFHSGRMDPNPNTKKYGQPSNNGCGEINSKFHEGSVYLHPDGKRMFFSSQGHDGMGGYDIYVSEKKQSVWQKPVNLGYPINTPYDDLFFAGTASGKYGFIASNRPGGKGELDIYKVTFWGEEKELAVDTEDFLLASIANPIKDNTIAKKVAVNKSSLTIFKGKTIDAITKESVEATMEIVDNSKGGALISKLTTNSATGKFLLSLTAGRNYGIAVKADGYLFHSENFDIVETTDFNMVDKVVELKNVAVGSKIALRNIFFSTGKSDLRPESNKELDRLVKLLKDVPRLKIEISGHTDNTGSATLNEKLSQNRAQAVVDYLSGRGISKSRLTAKGYGPTRPIATNNSAEGRQQNRRTEFEILAN